MSASATPPGGPTADPRADLRAPALGAVAWLAALAAFELPRPWLLGILGTWAVSVAVRRRRGRPVRTQLGWLVLATGVLVSTWLRVGAVTDNPVLALADAEAMVRGELVVTSDPVLRQGRFADYVSVRGRLHQVTGRGERHQVRVPVLVIGDRSWLEPPLGSRVRFSARLARATGDDLAAVLSTRGPPDVVAGPGPLLGGAEAVRAGVRAAMRDRPAGQRSLVPALVDGDDRGMPPGLAEDFRTAGLTHLLAVSGTNLTIVVGCLLILARAVGVRSRGLTVVGALGVLGFVALARTEPSVLRAAAMGTVALLGMGAHGRARGARNLGVAVLGLLLLDPWLARSVGFALSASATAGILWLAPGWRDRLRRWCPRWVAEAVSVPLAAQLACTPLVAAISGQVSLVAVGANLLVAPVVAPATVLGLLGGLCAVVWEPLGRCVATPAGWCAGWIIAVAERSADLPAAAAPWPLRPLDLAVLTVLCVVLAGLLGRVLSRRATALPAGLLMVVVVLVPAPTPGWPPEAWAMVACDVGQGDALVLNGGAGRAVVVDAGPDPRAVDRCLDRLHVSQVPQVVLTHFHADHVDGLAGVLSGREVGEVTVTGLAEPLGGVRLVRAVAAGADVPVRVATYGTVRRLGDLAWQVVAPQEPPPAGSGSPPNDASIVLLVQVRGLRLLLMGDEERPSQEALLRATGGLRADVLKVAHHGSASQDAELVRATGARLAVVSVGADNDYGHPAPSLLALLENARMRVVRTDRDGDVAVVARDGLRVVTRGARPGRAAG